jgi:hypothetical protein
MPTFALETTMAAYVKTSSDSIYLPRKGTAGPNGSDPFDFSNTLSWVNSLTGVTLPNWRKLVEEGKSATTPMSAEKIVIDSTPASYSTWYSVVAGSKNPDYQRYIDSEWSLDLQLPVISVDSVDTKALNDAQTKWNAKIYDVMTSFQGGVFLVELRQTLEMLHHPGKGLRVGLSHFLLSLKKGRRGLTQAQVLRYLSESWLEFVFGVMPLLNDIKDASSYLKTHEEKLKRELVRVRSNSGDLWGATARTHNVQGPPYNAMAWDVISKRGASASYSGAIKSEAFSAVTKVLDQTGFSPRSWLPTLYEVIPWSFVIDYFSNIGVIIESWTNQSLSLAWGSVTTKQFAVRTANSVVFDETPGSAATVWSISHSPGFYNSQRTKVNRSVVNSIPVPDIQYRIPGFDLKWLNLAALAITRSKLTPFRI